MKEVEGKYTPSVGEQHGREDPFIMPTWLHGGAHHSGHVQLVGLVGGWPDDWHPQQVSQDEGSLGFLQKMLRKYLEMFFLN